MTQQPTQELVVHVDNELAHYMRPPLIDIEGELAQLQNFRDFIQQALDESKGHYGAMPGVNRKFLQQPGAEIIYRALQARPEFTILDSEIDREHDYCYFLYKCEVIHVGTGTKMGEDIGTASSLEYANHCEGGSVPATWDNQNNRGNPGPSTVLCPIHGDVIPKRDKISNKWVWHCPKKTSQGLERTLQNTQSKAKKRAMVAAIRTVGCVSEMFSQDSDLMEDGGFGDQRDDRQQPAARNGAAPAAAPARKSSTKQAERPAPARQGPPPATDDHGTPMSPPTAPNRQVMDGFSLDEVKAAMAALKEALSLQEIVAFFEDAGTLAPEAALSAKALTSYCVKNNTSLGNMVAAAIERFQDTPATEPAVEGEFVDDVDDVPFE